MSAQEQEKEKARWCAAGGLDCGSGCLAVLGASKRTRCVAAIVYDGQIVRQARARRNAPISSNKRLHAAFEKRRALYGMEIAKRHFDRDRWKHRDI